MLANKDFVIIYNALFDYLKNNPSASDDYKSDIDELRERLYQLSKVTHQQMQMCPGDAGNRNDLRGHLAFLPFQ